MQWVILYTMFEKLLVLINISDLRAVRYFQICDEAKSLRKDLFSVNHLSFNEAEEVDLDNDEISTDTDYFWKK